MLLVALIPLLAAGCNKAEPKPVYGDKTLVVGGQTLRVETADNELARELGLSGRESLPEDGGMLFVFPALGKYGFWMKDMKFPLDIIWIREGKITEITANTKPEPGVNEASLFRYISHQEIDTVLEVNAGWTVKNKIKVGDGVDVRP